MAVENQIATWILSYFSNHAVSKRDRHHCVLRPDRFPAFGLLLLLGAASPAAAQTLSSALTTGATADFAPNDPPGEWRSQARDYANTRYSPLDQIKPDNVGQLASLGRFRTARSTGMKARRSWSVIRCMW